MILADLEERWEGQEGWSITGWPEVRYYAATRHPTPTSTEFLYSTTADGLDSKLLAEGCHPAGTGTRLIPIRPE